MAGPPQPSRMCDMNKISDSYAAPARRSVAAKALADRKFARRVVRARKGRGSYSRKNREGV